jgi:hypothetical protein
VLEGGVRKHGDQLRVTVRLVEAESQAQVWAEKFSGTLNDVFDMQERVALSVVSALQVRLSPTEKRMLIARPIEDARAFECYLKSRREIWRMTPEAIDRAEQLLERGLALVGENALLRATLGNVHWQRANLGIRPEDSLARADAQARRALELDPISPQGEYLLSLIVGGRGDIKAAIGHLRRALAVDPANADGLSALVLFYGYAGKTSAAFPLLERLISIDPLTPVHQATTAWLHLVDGRFELARDLYRELRRSSPEAPFYSFCYAQALAYAGAPGEACEVLDRLGREAAGSLTASLGGILACALRGDRPGVLDGVSPEVRAFASKAIFCSWLLADCHALIGEREVALEWLATTVDLGFVNYPFLSRLDPLLAALRGDELFEQLMRRVRAEWERFEV